MIGYPGYNFIRPQLPQPPGQMMPLGQPMMGQQQMGQPNGQFPLNPAGQQPTALPLGGQPLMGQMQPQHQPPMLGQNMMQPPQQGGQQHSMDGLWSRIMGMIGGNAFGRLGPMIGNEFGMAMNRRRGF
jgi:hypothetical protein